MSKHTARRSNRHGNAPSPYTKGKKAPYSYTAMYSRILTDEPDSQFAKHLRQRRKEVSR